MEELRLQMFDIPKSLDFQTEPSIKKAKKDGYAEGFKQGRGESILKRHEEGLKECRSEMRIEIAKRLKALEWSNSEIVKATGLSENEVLQIK